MYSRGFLFAYSVNYCCKNTDVYSVNYCCKNTDVYSVNYCSNEMKNTDVFFKAVGQHKKTTKSECLILCGDEF